MERKQKPQNFVRDHFKLIKLEIPPQNKEKLEKAKRQAELLSQLDRFLAAHRRRNIPRAKCPYCSAAF
jgi:hypothetical protein